MILFFKQQVSKESRSLHFKSIFSYNALFKIFLLTSMQSQLVNNKNPPTFFFLLSVVVYYYYYNREHHLRCCAPTLQSVK